MTDTKQIADHTILRKKKNYKKQSYQENKIQGDILITIIYKYSNKKFIPS